MNRGSKERFVGIDVSDSCNNMAIHDKFLDSNFSLSGKARQGMRWSRNGRMAQDRLRKKTVFPPVWLFVQEADVRLQIFLHH